MVDKASLAVGQPNTQLMVVNERTALVQTMRLVMGVQAAGPVVLVPVVPMAVTEEEPTGEQGRALQHGHLVIQQKHFIAAAAAAETAIQVEQGAEAMVFIIHLVVLEGPIQAVAAAESGIVGLRAMAAPVSS